MNNDKFFRRLDGSYNNLKYPSWGAKDTQLLRTTPAAYADGISEIVTRGENTPSPRLISNSLCNQRSQNKNTSGLSDFIWLWGQLLEHELSLTTPTDPAEEEPIQAKNGDAYLKEGESIPFERSAYALSTGFNEDNPRQQINQHSSFIDGTSIYGTSEARLNALRAWDGSGKMRVYHSRTGKLLPFNSTGLDNVIPPNHIDPCEFFTSGDTRANENIMLTSLHTLFVREHNRLCDRLIKNNPILTGKDEEIFQLARKLVGAIMQAITYNEFIPALLGKNALSKYQGYCDDVNPSISNIFSSACFRLSHNMLPNKLTLGKEQISLHETFFNPTLIKETGIEVWLQDRYRKASPKIDLTLSNDVRNFLFINSNDENQIPLDFASLNIHRGRDHGLADYNSTRKTYGLAPITRFSEITSDIDTQNTLKSLYNNTDSIDPWIGGLAEDHMEGAQVGEIIYTVLKNQFERLRDGDRYWYENDSILQGYQDKISTVTLAKVIERNTYLSDMQDNVFYV